MKIAAFIQDRRVRTSLLGIATDVLLSGIKFVLALVTGSAALLADALHSVTDLLVSLCLFVGISIRFRSEQTSSKNGQSGSYDSTAIPALTEQRIQKIEAFLALLVSFLILYVPFELISGLQAQSPESLSNIGVGITGVLLVMAILLFISRLKSKVGKETDSLALEADGYHSYIDLFTTAAVLFSLIGNMVGIYLDEMVAIVIAILIAVTGFELFISSLRSLFQNRQFEQISLFQSIADGFNRIPLGASFVLFFKRIKQLLYRQKATLLTLLIGAYVFSGFKVVSLGYEAIHFRFGQALSEPLSPGLHYLLPWPIDQLMQVSVGQIDEIQIGSQSELIQGGTDSQAGSKLWRQLPSTGAHLDESLYLVTSDENLVDLRFNIHYRVKNSSQLALQVQDLKDIIIPYAEGVLWKQTALTAYSEITDRSQGAFSQSVARQLIKNLDELGIHIEIIDARLESVQPPASVVATYRDLINADQERQQRLNVAIGEQLENIPLARARISAQKANAKASALEQILQAESETISMTSLSAIRNRHREAFDFNSTLNALVNVLKDKDIMVVDPEIDPRTLNAWESVALATGKP